MQAAALHLGLLGRPREGQVVDPAGVEQSFHDTEAACFYISMFLFALNGVSSGSWWGCTR